MIKFWHRVKVILAGKMKMTELSSQTGIPYGTITTWIKKDRIPPADKSLLIAKALGTSVEFLVDGSEYELPKSILGSEASEKKLKYSVQLSKIETLIRVLERLPDNRIDDLLNIAKAWDPGEPSKLGMA